MYYFIPNEIITIITSYLNKIEDIDNINIIFHDKINWLLLFRLKFQELYKPIINKYYIPNIYKDLIMHRCRVWEEYVPALTETAEYLFLNDILDVNVNLSPNDICKYDSAELFKKAKPFLSESQLRRFNCVNINMDILRSVCGENWEDFIVYL